MNGSRSKKKLLSVWALLAILVIAIVSLKISDWREEKAAQEDSLAAGERSLLPIRLKGINVVEIAYEDTLYRFERDQAGTWFFHAHGVSGVLAEHGHVADPGEGEIISTRLTGLGNARIERRLEDSNSKEQYGVTRPQLLLLVYGENPAKPLAQYAFGDTAPDKLSRYVLLVDSGDVVLVADYQAQNLIELIQEITATESGTPTGPTVPPPTKVIIPGSQQTTLGE